MMGGRGPGQPGQQGQFGPPGRGDAAGRPGPPQGMMPGMPGGHPPGMPRWPHQDWDGLKKSDPQLYKLTQADRDLERKARELSIQYRNAPSDRLDTIKKELTEVVNKRFDVRQERRELELKRLEAELKRLRDTFTRRNEAREKLVGKRVSKLLGEEDEIGF